MFTYNITLVLFSFAIIKTLNLIYFVLWMKILIRRIRMTLLFKKYIQAANNYRRGKNKYLIAQTKLNSSWQCSGTSVDYVESNRRNSGALGLLSIWEHLSPCQKKSTIAVVTTWYHVCQVWTHPCERIRPRIQHSPVLLISPMSWDQSVHPCPEHFHLNLLLPLRWT